MFTTLNKTWIGGGFGALEQSTAIDKAAKAHVDYIMANYFTPFLGVMTKELDVVQANGTLTGHAETPGVTGFTGARIEDQLTAAGYRSQAANSNVAFSRGDKPGDEPSVADCLSKLVNSVYHRSVLLSPLYMDVGIHL